MLYLSVDATEICSILYLVFGGLDLVICLLTSFIVIKYSPRHMFIYKWALVNTVLSGLFCDITASILSPVMIEPYLGFYSISKLKLSPILMHIFFCLYFVSVLYIILAISITYYYRIGISLSTAKAASLLKYTKLLYPFSYSLGPFGILALSINYATGIFDYTNDLISSDTSLWPLQQWDSPVALIYSLKLTCMRLFIGAFIFQLIAGTLFFAYAIRLMIQRWKSGEILISNQTNQIRKQMWHVMILQIVLFALTAGLPFVFYLATMFGAPSLLPLEVRSTSRI
ncbi:unnamed protein product, partial [Mesorhabditis belari]|uniref:Uncharacterized protein n=1 Tax=Mesorhabditis belari TaxID=2138241 RepID=A0AAF3FN64_9BILA